MHVRTSPFWDDNGEPLEHVTMQLVCDKCAAQADAA
jgi:hypothetical protein